MQRISRLSVSPYLHARNTNVFGVNNNFMALAKTTQALTRVTANSFGPPIDFRMFAGHIIE